MQRIFSPKTMVYTAVTYSKMPPCADLNASFSVKSAGGHVAAFVIRTWQSHFYTPPCGRGGFEKKWLDGFFVATRAHSNVVCWQSSDRLVAGRPRRFWEKGQFYCDQTVSSWPPGHIWILRVGNLVAGRQECDNWLIGGSPNSCCPTAIIQLLEIVQ